VTTVLDDNNRPSSLRVNAAGELRTTGAGGGGGGDASAANQVLQTTELQAIKNRLPPALGHRPADQSLSVTLADGVNVIGPAAQSALNVNLLTGVANGWYDADGMASVSLQLSVTAGLSAGQVIFEQTNDLSAPAALLAMRTTSATSSPPLTVHSPNLSVASTVVYEVNLSCRYFRPRISTAFVGATVQAFAVFSQATCSGVTVVQSLGASNSSTIAGPSQVTDLGSAAITTSATSSPLTPSFGPSYIVSLPILTVTGTTPTLDVVVQESDDSGSNWYDVYHFPRITALGMHRSPKLKLTGNRVRYIRTVGGTGPSFTMIVNRQQSSDPGAALRQLIDRTIVPNTLNSVTPFLLPDGAASRVQLVVDMGAITTTAPQFQIEGSENNGGNWFPIGAPLTAIANGSASLTVPDVHAGRLRVRVSTAGVGASLGGAGVLLKAF
jgi:hypothetical protein